MSSAPPVAVLYRRLTRHFDWAEYKREVDDAGKAEVASWRQTRESIPKPLRIVWSALARYSGNRDPWRYPPSTIDTEMEAAVGALVAAPGLVDAEEGSGSLEQVVGLVRTGRLRPMDLVNTGSGWTTVGEAPELMDAVEDVIRRRTLRRRLLWALAALTVGFGSWWLFGS